MINRFTLYFSDQKLEDKYQQFQLVDKRKPLAINIIIFAFIVVVIQGVVALINDNGRELYSSLAYLIGNIVLIIIVKYRPNYIRVIFIFISLSFVFSYIKVEQGKNQFHYQLASVLIVGLQFVIITTGEFLDALLQIVIMFLTYLIYFMSNQENYLYSIVVSTFILGLLLINSSYKNALAERSKFQLTLIEDQWDQILINTIKQPTIIFSFDLIKHTFVLKKSIQFNYICNTTEDLQFFLRTTQPKGQNISLEKFIYTQISIMKNTQDYQFQHRLLINSQKQIKEISYQIFPGASPIVLIQFPKISSLQENEKIEKLYQFKYLALLRALQLQFKNTYQKKFLDCQQIIKVLVYRDLVEKSRKVQLIQVFNLKKILQKLKMIYKDKKIKITGIMDDIICYKQLIILMLIEIFESILSKCIQIEIKSFQVESILEFKVIGEFNYKTIDSFRQRTQYLKKYFIKITSDDKCISFQITSSEKSEKDIQVPLIQQRNIF